MQNTVQILDVKGERKLPSIDSVLEYSISSSQSNLKFGTILENCHLRIKFQEKTEWAKRIWPNQESYIIISQLFFVVDELDLARPI